MDRWDFHRDSARPGHPVSGPWVCVYTVISHLRGFTAAALGLRGGVWLREAKEMGVMLNMVMIQPFTVDSCCILVLCLGQDHTQHMATFHARHAPHGPS